MNKLQHTEKVISTVRQKSNRALLFYSAGKDSICLLDLLAKEFDEVVCVFMYFVEGLEHIDRFIRFSETHYNNVRFIQTPHWNLTKIHRAGLFCQPKKVRQLMFGDVIQAMKLKTGIPYAFIGEKQADNLNRRLKLRGYELEAISITNNIYPLSHWKDADVLNYIKRNKLPKPISYGNNKRSNGVGFNEDCYVWLREYYPSDLEKILKAYPLSQKILFDYDQKIKRKRNEGN
ncbi:phosphoadenosine phosphosulfate reductase family protein [Riemerella anatipestifer]|nr:phosphoadenosine phosphosulfate reductase family protein [Riemerella anatipestifer]